MPRRLAALLPLLALACSAAPVDVDQSDDELTSLTARSRTLTFDGYVYVSPTASDAQILATVRSQTQTAFGALRTSEIGVNSRELKDVDAKTFVRSNVLAVNPAQPTAKGTPMVKVQYRYTDSAVVPVGMSARSGLSLAVMGPSYRSQTQRVLSECTANDSEAQEFSSSLWYVFEPRLSSCKRAIAAEQKQIDADRAALTDKTAVPTSEVNRLYVPITVKLGADKTNKGASYPEYDRLYAGGVEKGKLVISMVNGFIDHGSATRPIDDSGYGEWLEQLRYSLASHDFKLTSVEPKEDLTTATVAGKTLTGLRIEDVIAWHQDGTGWPTGVINRADRDALELAMGQKLIKHWITFEAPVNVTISGVTKASTIKIMTYFGADSSSAPHKRAIKTSDVFLYNGHSYIGYGPLDPSNFTASDFPASYQLMFVDGCVSYNYYEKDYFPLKAGGTKNLELITNGLEAPAGSSGVALGKFVAMLVGPKPASYRDLLGAARETDPLRVVDGELDNQFSPSKTPMTVTNR